MSNAFERAPGRKLEKYTPYKYVCFHQRALEYKLHLNKPQVSMCLRKLWPGRLEAGALRADIRPILREPYLGRCVKEARTAEGPTVAALWLSRLQFALGWLI